MTRCWMCGSLTADGACLSCRQPRELGLLEFDASADISYTFFRGYFPIPDGFAETVGKLLTLSGQATSALQVTPDHKVSVQLRGRFGGRVFTLYDYKGDMAVHIGGSSSLHVGDLIQALLVALDGVAPTPFTHRTGEGYGGERYGVDA